MIKLDHLRHFVVTTETGSFTAAASKANISPTSIRNSVENLESSLNTTLFVRKPSNGVSLTEDGKKLLEKSKDLLVTAEEIERLFVQQDRTLRGNLTIGCQEGLTWSLIPRAIKKINAMHPELSVSIKTVWMDKQFESLDNADVDVLVSFILPDDVPQKFHVVDLCAPQACAIMRKGHPLDNGQPVKLKDLARYPHIFIKDGPAWDLFYTMYTERNLSPEIYMFSNISTGAQSMVGCTDAVSLRILRPHNPYTPLGDPMVAPPVADKVRKPRLVAATTKLNPGLTLDKRNMVIDVLNSLFENDDMKAHIYY